MKFFVLQYEILIAIDLISGTLGNIEI